MGFFTKFTGRPQTEATSDAIKAAIEHARADKAKAERALADIEAVSPGEHADLDALADADRQAARLRSEIKFWSDRADKLGLDLAEAQAREQEQARAARREGVKKRAKGYAKVLAEYEKLAPAVAAALKEMATIETDVAAVNQEAARRGEALIEIIGANFSEPDDITPELPIMGERWIDPDGAWSVNQGVAGPRHVKARLERVLVGMTSGSVRRGRSIDAPSRAARLPAARIGDKDFFRGAGA